jgi:hypothetical protein
LIIAADFNCVLGFYLARQDFEIILNESFNNTENAHIEWHRKKTIRYFTKIKEYMVCLVLSLVFQTVFGIFLAPLVRLKSVK